MSDLATIRTAIKTTLEAAISDLHVDDLVRGANLPGVDMVVVLPETANFVVAGARGTDTWTLSLHVLVPTADVIVAQGRLDPLVTGAGDRSIREAIFNARTLGLSDVDAHVSGLTGYGLSFDWASLKHVGATLSMTVHTPGHE